MCTSRNMITYLTSSFFKVLGLSYMTWFNICRLKIPLDMINYNHHIIMFFIWFQNIRFESHGLVWHLYIKLVSRHVNAFKILGLGLVGPHNQNLLCLASHVKMGKLVLDYVFYKSLTHDLCQTSNCLHHTLLCSIYLFIFVSKILQFAFARFHVELSFIALQFVSSLPEYNL